MFVLTIAFAAIIILLLPETSYAWGPATHLDIGWKILHNSANIAAHVKALVDSNPYDFLYGNVSADIVVAKTLTEEKKHCHNWKVGFKVLNAAESDSQKAFSYGYLSHLAADTVAHNLFIPEMMVRSFSTTIHRHIYWEMRFDSLAGKRVWQLPEKIFSRAHSDNDLLLNSVLEGTPLSFNTNKRVFSSMLNLHRIERWHRMLDLLSIRSKWALHREDKERWLGMSMEAVEGFLMKLEDAPCVGIDPTGKKNLAEATKIRKKLKVARRSGKDWTGEMDRALKKLGV